VTWLLALVLFGVDAGVPARLELETPRLGASMEASRGQQQPQPVAPPPPVRGQDRAATRWMLVGGGAAVIVALALTMGRRASKDRP
jgi:hypothetical protein